MHKVYKRLSQNYYIVKSKAGEQFYEVNPLNATCSCRAFLFRGKQWIPCSHLRDIGEIHFGRTTRHKKESQIMVS